MLPKIITRIPGPKSRALAQKLRRYESRNITYLSDGFPVFWQRASGVNVWDVDGNRFLDLSSGFGVASLGYTPRNVVSAMRQQAGVLYHAMGDVHPAAVKVALCQTLSKLTFESWGVGRGKTVLTNSGSEAVEVALKTAFLATGKPGVIAFEGSYHGLQYGALTVTGMKDFRNPFVRQLARFAQFLPYPQQADMCPSEMKRMLQRALAKGEVGAIVVEPVLGRGGHVVPPDWFLPLLRRYADDAGLILIADEIYSGWWRTGQRFACDHWNVVPDVVCVGKALTSGFPMGACVGRARLMDAWPESDGEALHTSTFLGNPLGCRMALASLQALEKMLPSKRVMTLGQYLLAGLKSLAASHEKFKKPRGLGLLAGIEVVDKQGKPDAASAGRWVERLLAHGIVVLSAGASRHVLVFSPPFCIKKEEIDFLMKVIKN